MKVEKGIFNQINEIAENKFKQVCQIEEEAFETLKIEDYEEFIRGKINNNNILEIYHDYKFVKLPVSYDSFLKIIETQIHLLNLKIQEYLIEIPELIIFENKNHTEKTFLLFTYCKMRLLLKLITEQQELTNIRRLSIKAIILVIMVYHTNSLFTSFKVAEVEERFFLCKSSIKLERCDLHHHKLFYSIFILCPLQRATITKRRKRKGCFELSDMHLQYLNHILDFIVERRIIINDWLIRNGQNTTDYDLRAEYEKLKEKCQKETKCYGVSSVNIMTY